MSENLLHADFCANMGSAGDKCRQLLAQRAAEVINDTLDSVDPNLSVVIRARNERQRLEGLLEDIHAQQFNGEVQVLIVDSDSSDGTCEMARAHSAEIIPIAQTTYSHPKALNRGFEAADHPFIMTLVAHSNLVTTAAFKGVTKWANAPEFAGAYGPVALPDNHATIWERRATRVLRPELRLQPSSVVKDISRGAMLTHRTVYAKAAWEEMGRFDENYGAGGEDKVMARRMLDFGLLVAREPTLSIYHSHHLGPLGIIKQYFDYRRLSRPHAFDAGRLKYREIQ